MSTFWGSGIIDEISTCLDPGKILRHVYLVTSRKDSMKFIPGHIQERFYEISTCPGIILWTVYPGVNILFWNNYPPFQKMIPPNFRAFYMFYRFIWSPSELQRSLLRQKIKEKFYEMSTCLDSGKILWTAYLSRFRYDSMNCLPV